MREAGGFDVASDKEGDCPSSNVVTLVTGTLLLGAGPATAAGSSFAWGTVLRGADADISAHVALDPADNVYLAGATRLTKATFPITLGADLTYNGSSSDVFAATVSQSAVDPVGHRDGSSVPYM